MVQGSVGFGLAVVSAPVLLMLNPEFVPGSMMVAAFILTILLARREHDSIERQEVLISSVSRMITTLPTAAVVSLIDQRAFSIVFAVAVLAAVGISFSGYHLPFNRVNLALASGVSGITNTITAIGGPPMALVYQNQSGDHIRATLSVIFAIGTLISIIALACVGAFGWRDIVLGVALLPGVLTGFFVSRYTTPWLDARATRPAVLGVAGFSAAIILVRTLLTGS